MNFNFLTDIKLAEVVAPSVVKGKTKINRIPEGLAIRIYKDGSVYPSAQAVEQFHLEYGNKVEPVEFGGTILVRQGFDIVNSNQWKQYPEGIQPVLFLSTVAKSEPKVDLFAQVRYNEDGTPKNTVSEQGSKSEDLLASIEDIFGITVENFVDLQIVTDNTLTVEVAHLPKKVSRGPLKGEIKTERRENAVLYPLTLVVAEVPTEEVTADAEETN